MIQGVSHIGIAVRSIAEARSFYETLGLAIEKIEDVPAEGVRVAMIPCGTMRIELLEPLGEDSLVARFLEKCGPGIHHVCLDTDDVRSDGERLRAARFEVLRAAPSPGAGGTLVQFIHPRSAGGVLYELAESPDCGPNGPNVDSANPT